MRASHPHLAFVFLGLALGCGTASSAAKPSSPFTDNDTRLFESGVDMVGDPAELTGRWADDWSNEMRERVARSDFVALVTVNTVRTDISPEQHTTHWLIVGVDDVLKGGSGNRELSLASPQDALGFESVDRERGTILRRPLLLLAKWVAEPSGHVRPAWHLAPASQQVLAVVRSNLGGAGASTGSKTKVETIEYDGKP
jgi:hypothetical protein